MSQYSHRINLTPEVMEIWTRKVMSNCDDARVYASVMRRASTQPYPATRGIEGFPAWRVDLDTWTNDVLALVDDIVGLLGLLRATYPHETATLGYIRSINGKMEEIDNVTDRGHEILLHPAVKQGMLRGREEEEQQQQGDSASGSTGAASSAG